MITKEQYAKARKTTLDMLADACIDLTEVERENVEVADFGLDELEITGLQIITYENNDRYCAKELVMTPRQTCPEHRHPNLPDMKGKRETFRCRKGIVWLYVEGDATDGIKANVPASGDGAYNVFHEVQLLPGEQYTLQPNTLHWFQAGDDGAIVSEFSSTSRDDADIFSDKRISRTPEVAE